MFRVNESTAEIFLYDDIGPAWMGMIDDGIVSEALDQLKGRRVTARINSSGGDVFAMASIYNALTRHDGGVDTTVDGIAASAASYIFLAGENRTIAKNATVMVHYPWTFAIGNAADLRKTAEVLDKVGGTMAETYAERTGKPMAEVHEILSAESWFTSSESLTAGLATAIGNVIVEDSAVAASVASFKASRGYPQRAREDAQEATPYRVAAKLQAIKSKNRSSQLLTNARKSG